MAKYTVELDDRYSETGVVFEGLQADGPEQAGQEALAKMANREDWVVTGVTEQ